MHEFCCDVRGPVVFYPRDERDRVDRRARAYEDSEMRSCDPQRSLKKIARAILIRIGIVAAVLLGFACLLFGPLLPRAFQSVSLRTRILSRADHQALLSACQNLAEQVRTGKLKAGSYQIRPFADPEVSGFPRAIRDLRPAQVLVDRDGRVMVEMFGGLAHFGVYAYPEGYREPFSGFKYGDRELIPNLWYYDDEYYKDPEFDKTVDAIVKKRKGEKAN